MKKINSCILFFLLTFYSLNATGYYVDATYGSDASGDGSSDHPWQTITYALSQISGTGHAIYIAEGTYDSTLGEVFPIYLENGVSLIGAGIDLSIIDGSSSAECVFNCISIVDASTTIEGLTITGGEGTTCGGFFVSAGSALTIFNNKIIENSTDGIYIQNSTPKILNNIFSDNGFSSIYISDSSPVVKGNTVMNNLEYSIYITGSNSAPSIINNIIAFNSDYGIYCSSSCTPSIINNTISDNASNGIYIYEASPDSICNNIISYNSGYGIYESTVSSDPGIVSYNLFYLNSSGIYYDEGSTVYNTSDAMNSGVAECENNIDGDPMFTDKASGDFHELPYSPAVDTGDPSLPYNNEPESNGDRINIGAYGNTAEAAIYSEPPEWTADLYVDASAGSNETGDGSSGNPWQTITYTLSRISGTGHTINVAAGTYNTALGEVFPIYLKDGISLAGAGIDISIIDADQTNSVIKCISIFDSSTSVEGFTIMGGYLTYPANPAGTGIFISGGSLVKIAHNKIADNNIEHHPWNMSNQKGVGIYIENSTPVILNNIITNNSGSFTVGSGIFIYNSSPLIEGNQIVDNPSWTGAYGDGSGFAIAGSLSSPLVINNIIADNGEHGIRISESSNPKIQKNVIINNIGDGIQVISSDPRILNNTISGNGGHGLYVSSTTLDSVINNIISYNTKYGIYESGGSSDPGKVWYNLFYANSSGLYYDEGSTAYYTASSLNASVAECKNNIDGDPLFADRTNDDYHIQSGSPAIDAGDPNSPFDPDGSRADIGAYYFIMPPPDAPVATAATNVGQTDFTANWNSAATATGYYLDIATDADFTTFVEDFENRDVLNLTSYSVTGLSSNTEFYYRVRAYNEGGTSSNSNVIALSTTVDPPAPPSAPVVYVGTDISQTSFLADWETTNAATSYRIDVAVEIDPVNYVSGYYNLEVLNATECMVTGLTANTDYYYWVRACNSGGASANSDTVVVTTLINPPPAPEALESTDITQTSFTANWNSSVNADGYFLDVSEEDTFDSFVSGYNYLDVSNVTSYSVTGLIENTTYYYRVEAYNTGGTGGYSETITVTTLPDPPPAPTCNDASDLTQTSFTANWNSSSTATGYFLDVAGDNYFTNWVLEGAYAQLDVSDVTSYNVTGLSSNNTYYYRVTAYNAGGTSDYSETIIVSTLHDPPPAPVAYDATDILQESFTANWESTATATGYLIEVATDIDFTEFVGEYYGMDVYNVLSYSVTGLSPNTTYYYRITSYNEGGTDGYSDAITVITLQVPVPDAPVANEAPFVGQTDFTASWNSSETATGYYLDVCYDSEFTSCNPYNLDVGNGTSYSIMGLTANTTYYYRVRAYNDGGTSDNSNTITLTTLLNPPDPPVAPVPNDATDIIQTSFTANWNSSDNATGYKLDVATDDAFINFVSGYDDIDLTNTTSYSITGLTANTTYYYMLRAYNSGGTSDNSETITVTTLPWAPPVPYPYEATSITTTSFTANWETTDGAIGYALHIATDEAFTQFVTGYQNLDVFNVTSYEVTGLDPNTTYYYCVSAYNGGGESSNSGGIQVTTLLEMPDLPDAPTADPATNITQTKFQANWTPASGTDGFYLDVAYDDTFSSYVTGYNNLDVGYDISLDIGGLSSNTVYYYRVRGHNVSGTGDNSNVVSVTTLPDPPPAPTGLSASSCNNEVYLQWDQTTEAGFMQYNVYWGTAPAPSSLYASYNNPSWNAITISDLVNGQTYYFRVTTVISPGVESDYSTTTSVKVKTGVIPRIKSKWGKVLICYNPNDSLTSFQWFVGTSSITGATAQYHVTTGQSGYYYVVASDHDGCYNHSNLVYISGSKSISVYPNPAKSNFTLNLSSDFMGETVVTIYNSTGIKSMEYRTEKRDIDLNCEIPVGNLKDGIYTIEVNVNDEEIEYTKLIIIE